MATTSTSSTNKLFVEGWTREKKLEKISQYSACQVETCKCNGFKSAAAAAAVAASTSTTTSDLAINSNENHHDTTVSALSCKFCSHLLSNIKMFFLIFMLIGRPPSNQAGRPIGRAGPLS
jgi:hypothetical protein